MMEFVRKAGKNNVFETFGNGSKEVYIKNQSSFKNEGVFLIKKRGGSQAVVITKNGKVIYTYPESENPKNISNFFIKIANGDISLNDIKVKEFYLNPTVREQLKKTFEKLCHKALIKKVEESGVECEAFNLAFEKSFYKKKAKPVLDQYDTTRNYIIKIKDKKQSIKAKNDLNK